MKMSQFKNLAEKIIHLEDRRVSLEQEAYQLRRNNKDEEAEVIHLKINEISEQIRVLLDTDICTCGGSKC